MTEYATVKKRNKVLINFKSTYICIQVTNMFEKEMEVWDKIARNLYKIYDSCSSFMENSVAQWNMHTYVLTLTF